MKKWKNAVNKGKILGALLTDLSKTFDCLNHELLIAKLNGHSFTLHALKLIHNFISNRKQRVRVNDSYGFWQDILFGLYQSSILGPFLNMFLAYLFFTLNNRKIASYADSTTAYGISNNTDD